MSVITVTPTLDTIVELDDDKTYVMIDAAWEYDRSRYILPVDMKALPGDWVAFLRQFVRRDEALTIEHVTYL